jgi:hypothetical protein
MLGLTPSALVIRVTISAGGLFGDRIVVADKSGGSSNRLIEWVSVTVDYLFARACGKDCRSEERCRKEA